MKESDQTSSPLEISTTSTTGFDNDEEVRLTKKEKRQIFFPFRVKATTQYTCATYGVSTDSISP